MTCDLYRDCKGDCFRAKQSSEKISLEITNQFSCGFVGPFHIAQQVKIWDFENNGKIQLW